MFENQNLIVSSDEINFHNLFTLNKLSLTHFDFNQDVANIENSVLEKCFNYFSKSSSFQISYFSLFNNNNFFKQLSIQKIYPESIKKFKLQLFSLSKTYYY